MSRSTLIVGAWVVAAVAVIVLFLRAWVLAEAPSREECVALWNAPRNAAHRQEVTNRGYPSAEINGAFSEERYQGCFATFANDVGKPWALYSATRIPGTEARLEWRLDAQAQRWGTGFPPPRDRPRPNASVQPDGSLSLA
jgi:hypothetical protein